MTGAGELKGRAFELPPTKFLQKTFKKNKKKKIAPSGKKAGMDRFYFRIKGNLFFRKPRMNI